MTNKEMILTMSVIVVIFLVLIILGTHRLDNLQERCEGTVVKTVNGWECIDAKVVR